MRLLRERPKRTRRRANVGTTPLLRPRGIPEARTERFVARALGKPSTSEQQCTPAIRQEVPLSEINWALELKKIEREFDGLPPEPSPNDHRQKRDTERREREKQEAIAASFGVYFRLTLVVSLAISLVCWPYDVTCGAMVFGYLAAVVVLVVGGIWTAVATFAHQMPWRHLVALMMVLWGLALGAAEVLPRIGYAVPAPGRSTDWSCSG